MSDLAEQVYNDLLETEKALGHEPAGGSRKMARTLVEAAGGDEEDYLEVVGLLKVRERQQTRRDRLDAHWAGR